METSEDQPTLKQEIDDLHQQLGKANKDISAGKNAALENIDQQIHELVENLQSQVIDMEPAERENILTGLQNIMAELNTLEALFKKNQPKPPLNKKEEPS